MPHRSESALQITFKRPPLFQVMGYGLLGLAVMVAYLAYGLDWSQTFQHENIVEFGYHNAASLVGLGMWLGFVCFAMVLLTQEILEVDARTATITHRLSLPLQPPKRYPFSQFHTTKAEVHRGQRGQSYFLNLVGGTGTVSFMEPDLASAKEHARALAEHCQWGFESRPFWDAVNAPSGLSPTKGSASPPQRSSMRRVQTPNGFDLHFPKGAIWRWLLFIPYVGLMLASWYSFTPWYIYLVWTALCAGAIVWFGQISKDHIFRVEGTKVSYHDHFNKQIYRIALSQYPYLDLKGGDILCARPNFYEILELPRASEAEKVWLKDELRRIAGRA